MVGVAGRFFFFLASSSSSSSSSTSPAGGASKSSFLRGRFSGGGARSSGSGGGRSSFCSSRRLSFGQGRRGRLHQELAEAVVAVGAEPEALVVAQREEVLEEGGRGPLEQVVARGEPHAQVEGERADLHEGLVRGRHHQRQAHRRALGAGRVPHGDRVDVDGLQLRPRGPRVLVDVPRVGAGDPVVDGEGEVLLGGLERGGVVGEVRQVERGVGDAAARVQRDEALDAEFHGAGGGAAG